MMKQFSTCNWVPSRITETQINGYVTTGALASKRVLHWRVPDSECPSEPQDGEVIVFMQHLDRGFSPPDHKNSGMSSQASNSIRKISVQTPYQTYATFKYSVKFIFKKSQPWSYSGISFIWTVAQNFMTVQTLSSAGCPFRRERTLVFLMPITTVTPKSGIKLGSIV